MMRILRNRFLWGILGVVAGVWAVRAMRDMQEEQRAIVRRGRMMWRRGNRTRMAGRPLGIAAKAGRAMMDTTMRTVRAMGRE